MKIAIIGATGFVGSRLLTEALNRNHDVTAIAKDPSALPSASNLHASKLDVTDVDALARALAGHDVVISAFNPGKDPDGSGVAAILAAVRQAKVDRLLVVGGAGTLEIAPGRRVVDEPDFPMEWKAGALKTAAFLDLLRGETEIDWVFVSPAADLNPGERTGRYRVGGDHLMVDDTGKSRISLEDYSVALLDEAERPAHHRARMSVAY
jgi:putative NADH-flavin reductase